MASEPMTEQQMREYLESVWERVHVEYVKRDSTWVSFGPADGDWIESLWDYSAAGPLRAAVEFTERRREEIRQKEEDIEFVKLVYFGFYCSPESDKMHAPRQRILAVLESQLTELRRGLKEGAFRGN